MKCQRARIVTGQLDSGKPSIGLELWIIAKPPIIPRIAEGFYSKRDFTVFPHFETAYRSKRDLSRAISVVQETIEFLARGPEDFIELDEYLSMEEWEKENGLR